jgi:hypothetical protein
MDESAMIEPACTVIVRYRYHEPRIRVQCTTPDTMSGICIWIISRMTTLFGELNSGKWSRQLLRSIQASLAVLVLFCSVAPAHSSYQDPPGAPLPERVGNLAKQLYGVPLDESSPITSQIQDVVVTHAQQWLIDRTSKGAPSDVDIRRELERVFAQVQYPIYAWPAVFVRQWKESTLYGVGYTLGWSDYDRTNVIALFEKGHSQPRLAVINHFAPHADLHYAFMALPPNGDFRFLAYGTRLGKSQRRLTVILYSFDGHALKPLWELQDAYDGRIRVAADSVTIRYLNESEYVRALALHRRPPRYESIYKPTAQGMALESTREIPFGVP